MSPRILIIHDRFQFRGGAERMVLDMARILHADLVTEFWTDETFSKSDVPHGLTILDEGEPAKMVWRYFRAQKNFLKATKIAKRYDTVIFSGNNCLAASWFLPKRTKTFLYCHTPVRYVYDLHARRRADEPKLWKRFFYYDIGKYLVRAFYRIGLSRMQTVVANSENVQERLWRYCNRRSEVLNPPIQTEKFVWHGQGDYYLSFARLDKLKRVYDIVRAFQKMPNKKLVVCSGGEESEAIRELARGYSNINVNGWVDNETLANLIGNCIATLYLPVDEDFGMTPLESMSAGKPCIGVKEGGVKESIIEVKTGLFVPADYTIEDIVSAIKILTPEMAFAMKDACIERASEFSVERFESNLKSFLIKKRVVIDASRSAGGIQKTGVEVVSDALLHAMEITRPDEVDITYATLRAIIWLPEDKQLVIRWRRFWTLAGLSSVLFKLRPDALFVPVHTLPFFCPKRTAKIIHDVAFLKHPELYGCFARQYLRFDFRRSTRAASKIFVPTEAVRQDVLRFARNAERKVEVLSFGYERKLDVSHRSNKSNTILFVGRVETKKNTANLIRAFARFRGTHTDWKLIIAGKPGHGFEEIEPLLSLAGVEYLGYVSDEDKFRLLSSARILAFISREEGFAIPMLEAFDFGAVVLASDIPVLREVGGEACIYVAPDDVVNIADGLCKLADDEKLRNDLISKGAERLADFSWERAAKQVWRSLIL
ncbi:MAG: glycosyltransferase [Patescibacteria group bacterium]